MFKLNNEITALNTSFLRVFFIVPQKLRNHFRCPLLAHPLNFCLQLNPFILLFNTYNMKITTKLSLCGLLIALSCQLHAQDRFFAFTSQSNVLPKGTRSIEVWYANKQGGQVYYNGNFARLGFKMGLGSNVLTQFYANFNSVAQVESEIDPIDKVTRTYGSSIEKTSDVSFSNETKWKILDPAANAVGLAIFNELTVGSTYFRFSPKLILDKRVGQNFFVFNALFEAETRWVTATTPPNRNVAPTVEKQSEQPFEFGLAYMRFTKNNKLGFGIEARNHNEVLPGTGWEHSVLFIGPALHFHDDKWFFNLTALPQIANLRHSWIAPESKVLDEHQNFELRTQLGFMF